MMQRWNCGDQGRKASVDYSVSVVGSNGSNMHQSLYQSQTIPVTVSSLGTLNCFEEPKNLAVTREALLLGQRKGGTKSACLLPYVSPPLDSPLSDSFSPT